MMDSKAVTGADRPSAPAPAETRFTDPVCGMEVDGKGKGYTRTYQERSYRFCSLGCVEKFEAHPERFSKVHDR